MTTDVNQFTQDATTDEARPLSTTQVPETDIKTQGAHEESPASKAADAAADAGHARSVEAATGSTDPKPSAPAQDAQLVDPPKAEQPELLNAPAPVATETNEALAALKPKQEIHGKVTRIELYGAFIDLGVGHDGLLHISQISDEHVRNVHDKLAIGQEVTVWVRSVDVQNGRIDLTMIKPAATSWDELRAGQEVTGKVVQIEKYGVFLDIGAERPGLIHVSELANEYVKSPSDVVKMGEELRARVLKVSAKKRQIDLSVKALFEQPTKAEAVEDEDLKNLPTAMELAMRNAMQGTEMADQLASFKPKAQPNRAKKDKPQRQQQTAIAMRTLQNRPK